MLPLCPSLLTDSLSCCFPQTLRERSAPSKHTEALTTKSTAEKKLKDDDDDDDDSPANLCSSVDLDKVRGGGVNLCVCVWVGLATVERLTIRLFTLPGFKSISVPPPVTLGKHTARQWQKRHMEQLLLDVSQFALDLDCN